MNDITALAQRMKAAAEKAKYAGEAPVMPFDTRITALNEFQLAACPVTVLALLDEPEDADKAAASGIEWMKRCLAAEKRIAELEAREVKIPELKMLRDYLAEVNHREREDILLGLKLEFHRELVAAGIITKVGE